MEVTDEGIVTEARELQPWKALPPMEVTDEGIVTEARELQPWKARFPMEVTVMGIVTEVREVHCWKALSPMEVTDEGIVTETRELQLWKAFTPMEVTDEGMSTFPFASGVYRQPADATQLEHTSAKDCAHEDPQPRPSSSSLPGPSPRPPKLGSRREHCWRACRRAQSGAAQREGRSRQRGGGRAGGERDSELCAKGTGSCCRRRLCAS